MGTHENTNFGVAADDPTEDSDSNDNEYDDSNDYNYNEDNDRVGRGPSFTLYASDRHAAGTLRDYLGRVNSDGTAGPEYCGEVEQVINVMETWQLDNPYEVRTVGTAGVDEPAHVSDVDSHNKTSEANMAAQAKRDAGITAADTNNPDDDVVDGVDSDGVAFEDEDRD